MKMDMVLHIGDVFVATDPREPSRRLTVVGLEPAFIIVRSGTGRHSRINKKRLRPTRGKRGYRRVATKLVGAVSTGKGTG